MLDLSDGKPSIEYECKNCGFQFVDEEDDMMCCPRCFSDDVVPLDEDDG